jgi:hypothetical protein
MRHQVRSFMLLGFLVALAVLPLGPSLAAGPADSEPQGGTRLVVFEAFMNPG